MTPDLDQLALRIHAQLARTFGPDDRVLIGITGSPGSGKSTLAQLVLERMRAELGPDAVAYVPMDGFHLADVELERLGLRDLKGVPETFDSDGYLNLLERITHGIGVIYAPAFDRTIEQPIAGSILVPEEAQLIITEGNYLLLRGYPWGLLHNSLTEVWFCRLDETTRRERLLERHVRFGKSPEFARDWMKRVDDPNAALIEATIEDAGLVIDVD
jgi:pantothenate kinase